MKLKLTAVTVLISTLFIFGVFAPSRVESNEFGQNAYLAIDGKEYKLLIGKEVQLKIDDKQHSVKIRLDPYSVFNKAGIKFKFFASMFLGFDDSSPNVKIWSIDGDNSVIMIQEFNGLVDETEIINAFTDQYAQMKANVAIKGIQMKGKHAVLDGNRINIRMGDIRLSQDVYVISKGTHTTAIILQDTLDDNKRNTTEYANLLKIFTETFEVLE